MGRFFRLYCVINCPLDIFQAVTFGYDSFRQTFAAMTTS